MSQRVLFDYLGQYKDQVDAQIETEISTRLEDVKRISSHLVPVVTAMKELSVGGKRLRAMLTILGYQIAGGPPSHTASVVKAAAAMEIFHLGLLIQDDWMDRDETRRGVQTIHTRYPDPHTGNFVAMLAGDYTFGWTAEILAGLKLSAHRVAAALGVWGKYMTRVGYGQTLDGLAIADEETILQILKLKSGEYSCILPLELGATLGGAKPDLIKNLQEYGMELGWVFQLRDDWLGMYGDPEKTGKPVGHDEREGKHSFATMYGRKKTEAAIAEHMERGKELAMGNKILIELVDWLGTREN